MDLVLCHTTADFDTLGAAVGLTRLMPGARIVLTGGCHPTVQRFVAFHRDEYPLIERRAVNADQIRSLTLVDAQHPERFGPCAEWITAAERQGIPINLYDHHGETQGGVAATHRVVEPVGAATTLVVEELRRRAISPTVAEATVMALGIHVDTGSLIYEQSTPRDAEALAWLMAQGASLRAISEFVEPGLSPSLQDLLATALDTFQEETVQGHCLAWVTLELPQYTPGLSGLAERLISLADADVLLFGAHYGKEADSERKLLIVGRARGRISQGAREQGVDLGTLFKDMGGGGHATAASVSLTTEDPAAVMKEMLHRVRSQLPQPPNARDLMSSPVRTIRPETTIREAQRILLRYGHSGLSVVNAEDELVGMISRRDLDLALHHGFSHAPVKGYMATSVKTIAPDTPLPDIEELMVTYDIGRLPVLEQGALVGVVTRTDVLRHLHQDQIHTGRQNPESGLQLPPASTLRTTLKNRFKPALWQVLQDIAAAAQQRGWHVYLVGGAVRDLLLNRESAEEQSPDLDLVVDGFYQTARVGAGVDLAAVIKTHYPEVDLQTYGRFQTAALVWHKDLNHPLASLMIDIATARTEFYPYPAANPEVEASSIQQDLYRRDFTINAMAIRLTEPGAGQLLDFFGGLVDLQQQTIRVLHSNSFIEDPTRIYRAVRFAVRLKFTLDPQTEGFIHHAIDSGIYTQMQQQVQQVPALQSRLKNELKYILEAHYWQPALGLLDKLRALRCIHSDLAMTPRLWQQLRRISRWIQRFGWQHHCPPWQIRLEILLATIPNPQRGNIAASLQLNESAITRLKQLDNLEQRWLNELSADLPPSRIYHLLSKADLPSLLLASARHPKRLGPTIWCYLTHWADLPPLINGHQLKAMGYRPGPQFKTILETLFNAQLDRQITSLPEAKTLLSEQFPLQAKHQRRGS
jgi:tRNA nucleotidyltransferase (CCA-adding enzyme)